MQDDLQKLLLLQSRDTALLAVDVQLAALLDQVTALDRELEHARRTAEQARQALAAANRHRESVETKVESLRVLQDRRRQRAESVRTARELQALSTELELGRAGLVREEGEWLRVSEQVAGLETAVKEAEALTAELEAAQTEERAQLAEQIGAMEAERNAAVEAREEAAGVLARPLLTRYDRLFQARSAEVVVAVRGHACGNCFTAIPMSRRSQIRAGTVLEVCETCGVMLYAADNDA